MKPLPLAEYILFLACNKLTGLSVPIRCILLHSSCKLTLQSPYGNWISLKLKLSKSKNKTSKRTYFRFTKSSSIFYLSLTSITYVTISWLYALRCTYEII